MIQDDEDFCTEFESAYNSYSIPEADDFTPETLEDIYLGMEIALPYDSYSPEFAKVTKCLCDKDRLPIGTTNDNSILDSCLYKVEYPDGHKAALAANFMAENIFTQVDNEGNRFVLLNVIADYCVDSSELKGDDRFITLLNGSRRR